MIGFQRFSAIEVAERIEDGRILSDESPESKEMLIQWLRQAWYSRIAIENTRIALADCERAVEKKTNQRRVRG